MSYMSASLCKALEAQGLKIFPSTNILANFSYRGPVYAGQHSTLVRSKIDSFSYIGTHSTCTTSSIGRYCSISYYVQIGLGQHDITEISTSSAFYSSNIFDFAGYHSNRLTSYSTKRHGEETTNVTIGNDVWIGTNVIFPSDVKVGSGAAIGAGSVITKDVPPYAIVVGNNRILRYRFSDELISDLLELNWWDYNLPEMIKQGIDLPVNKPKEFISRFKDLDPAKLIPLNKTWYVMKVPNSAEPLNTVQLKPATQVTQYFDPRSKE